MNTYLAIITTMLVLTQIVRIILIQISLNMQEKLTKAQLGQIKEYDLNKDLETQKEAYRLIVEHLGGKEDE